MNIPFLYLISYGYVPTTRPVHAFVNFKKMKFVNIDFHQKFLYSRIRKNEKTRKWEFNNYFDGGTWKESVDIVNENLDRIQKNPLDYFPHL